MSKDFEKRKKKLIEAFDKLDSETKLKRLADKIEVSSEDVKRFGKVLERFKDRQRKRQEYAEAYGADKLAEQDDKSANFARRYSGFNVEGTETKRSKENRRKWFNKRREELKEEDSYVKAKSRTFAKIYGAKKPRFLGRLFRKREQDFGGSGGFNTEGTKTETKRRGLFGRLREPGRFFAPERIKERHDFRVKVSGNRKWIMIGLAVVVICGTIIYLSVTYGGGGFSFITKFLGVFK